MQPTALLSIEATERTRPRALKRKRGQGREGVSGIGCLTSRVRPVEHIRPAAPLRTVGYCRVLAGAVGEDSSGVVSVALGEAMQVRARHDRQSRVVSRVVLP